MIQVTPKAAQRIRHIVAKEGGLDAAGAKSYLTRLAREGRYLRDVY